MTTTPEVEISSICLLTFDSSTICYGCRRNSIHHHHHAGESEMTKLEIAIANRRRATIALDATYDAVGPGRYMMLAFRAYDAAGDALEAIQPGLSHASYPKTPEERVARPMSRALYRRVQKAVKGVSVDLDEEIGGPVAL